MLEAMTQAAAWTVRLGEDFAHAIVVQCQSPTWAMRAALARTYIGRVGNTADQQVVLQLLDAAGIGPSTWRIESRSEPGHGGGR